MNKKLLIDSLLPPVSKEDIAEALIIRIKEANGDVRQRAEKDPLKQMEKNVWMKLQNDVYENNLIAEFADFYLEHPGFNILEINSMFRVKWDI